MSFPLLQALVRNGEEIRRDIWRRESSEVDFARLLYTVREIVELPARVFNFLIKSVEDFVRSRELALLLYRDDINKVVLGDFDPEEEDLFMRFLAYELSPLRCIRPEN
ncbi:hypothetical protein TEQG_08347 [Trichophyton equinum CBS 127.97]|uniref:Uncharacterized protein n=1 Tax=Trichophyton equinum (strain ATCC MYA-4606 / CBS 127.97) TaxID=559882 RepID=F2Q5M8_TRIEC|nr:hypothetical protein TEQG_08347 [Trichophyton equinum CBS 127.97]